MGNRRIGRKRLYAVEKAGKKIDLGAGVGIKNCIKSVSQHRNGQELITEIAVDFGGGVAHSQTISDGGGTGGVMGEAGADCSITELTVAKYGHITEIRAIMLEAITGNVNSSLSLHASAANGDQTTPTPLSTVVDLNVIGEDKSELYTASTSTAGKFLHIEQGASSNSNTDITAGKLLIYIHGFEEPADI